MERVVLTGGLTRELLPDDCADRCPACGNLNPAIIASSEPTTTCNACHWITPLKDWTRLHKDVEMPRPDAGSLGW